MQNVQDPQGPHSRQSFPRPRPVGKGGKGENTMSTMLRFRPPSSLPLLPVPADSPLTLDVVSTLADCSLLPGHFFLDARLTLVRVDIEHEELAWEIFRGR